MELTDEGYEVVTAKDGSQALDSIRNHKPDLVVLDIAMPKMDGLQCMREIRQGRRAQNSWRSSEKS